MDDIVRATGETALLTVPVGWTAMCVESVEPRRPVRLSYRRGVALPMHAGASGKPLLAHLPGLQVQEYLRASGLTRFTTRSFTVDDLYRQLDQVRRTGVCVTVGELDPDQIGIGVPVRWDGQVAACLSVAGPRVELSRERVGQTVDLLRRCSRRLAAVLAGDKHPEPSAPAWTARPSRKVVPPHRTARIGPDVRPDLNGTATAP